MPEGGAASGDGGGAAGGGGGGADALAGLGGLGALGGALGAAGGGAGAAPRAQLPNPGKFDEADGACSQVMDFQTWDGVTIEYTKQANHSQVAQLQMAHGIKLGNARTEGYSLTTTYASQSLFMQGVTSSNLDLQGVLLAQDFLPGMTFKFQPGMGIESGGGEINQATFELTSKGTDWAATVSVTPSAQTHALATYMQSLTKKWSAGFKIEGISVAVPQVSWCMACTPERTHARTHECHAKPSLRTSPAWSWPAGNGCVLIFGVVVWRAPQTPPNRATSRSPTCWLPTSSRCSGARCPTPARCVHTRVAHVTPGPAQKWRCLERACASVHCRGDCRLLSACRPAGRPAGVRSVPCAADRRHGPRCASALSRAHARTHAAAHHDAQARGPRPFQRCVAVSTALFPTPSSCPALPWSVSCAMMPTTMVVTVTGDAWWRRRGVLAGPKSTVVASLTTPFPGDGYMPNPMLPPGTSQVGYGWLSQVIWGFPRLRASYIHRLGDAQVGVLFVLFCLERHPSQPTRVLLSGRWWASGVLGFECGAVAAAAAAAAAAACCLLLLLLGVAISRSRGWEVLSRLAPTSISGSMPRPA
jgi:hypothetical protein